MNPRKDLLLRLLFDCLVERKGCSGLKAIKSIISAAVADFVQMETQDERVTTFLPMTNSRLRYSVTSHSTYCDVMCTTNTYKVFDVRSFGNEAIAHMPFLKSKTLQMPVPLKSATLMQKLKVIENRNRRNLILKQEREEYLFKLNFEEERKKDELNRAATLIQTQFRGHRCRPLQKRRDPYVRVKFVIKKITLSEMHESLCEMAHNLNLKPINGLNLESKAKTSRRKAKIEAAAVFRLVRYFRMLRAKFVARREMKAMQYERVDRMARTITRFFRFIKMKKWNKNLQKENQTKAAYVLQNSYRCFAARKRLVLVNYEWLWLLVIVCLLILLFCCIVFCFYFLDFEICEKQCIECDAKKKLPSKSSVLLVQ